MDKKSKRGVIPEQVFLDGLKSKITNFFIENKNFQNGYYITNGRMDYHKLLEDMKWLGTILLQYVDSTKHLVIDDKDEDLLLCQKIRKNNTLPSNKNLTDFWD